MTTTEHQQPAARTLYPKVECAGCGVLFKANGKQRQIVAEGRPVYHSQDCRKKHTWVTQQCTGCGIDVTRPRSEANRNTTGRVFCSTECRNKVGSKPKTGRMVPCANCGKDRWVIRALDTTDRYCSRECAVEAARGGRVKQTCQQCGKTELVPPSKVSPFCSTTCAGLARRRAPGETWIDPEKGYVWEFIEGGGRKLQHRLRFEELLGRPLLTEEEVHHLSGDKTDNTVDGPPEVWHGKLRSGNLELWSESQPAGQEVPAKVAWARKILALYGDLVPEVTP